MAPHSSTLAWKIPWTEDRPHTFLVPSSLLAYSLEARGVPLASRPLDVTTEVSPGRGVQEDKEG